MIRALAFLVALAIASPLQAQVTITPSSGVSGSGVVTSSQLLAPDGSAAAPAYSFASDPDTGWYWESSGSMAASANGTLRARVNSTGLAVNGRLTADTIALDFNNSTDVFLSRDAANTLAQRNGVNAQTFRIYGSDPTTSARRLELSASATGALVGSNWASGAIDLGFTAGTGVATWKILASGNHLVAATDNTYDIGASGATRPRNIYAAGTIVSGASYIAGSAGAFYFSGSTIIRDISDGVVALRNNAETGFTRLILGTNDESGIAISKNAQTFEFRLGNDSGAANINAAAGTFSGVLSSSTYLSIAGQGRLGTLSDGAFRILNGGGSALATMATLGVTASGPTSGIGYATGAGGTVTQLTSKATGVTLNTIVGEITTTASALAADTAVNFTLTNAAIAALDMIVVSYSGGTAGAYSVHAIPSAAGAAAFTIRNLTAGSLSEAIVIRYMVFKSVTS